MDSSTDNDEVKEKVLAEMSPYLYRSLGDPTRYIPHLMARHVLDVTDKDAVKAEEMSEKKVKVFVDMLKKKGACAFDGLVEVLLEERVESHIARKLQQAFRNEQENALSWESEYAELAIKHWDYSKLQDSC